MVHTSGTVPYQLFIFSSQFSKHNWEIPRPSWHWRLFPESFAREGRAVAVCSLIFSDFLSGRQANPDVLGRAGAQLSLKHVETKRPDLIRPYQGHQYKSLQIPCSLNSIVHSCSFHDPRYDFNCLDDALQTWHCLKLRGHLRDEGICRSRQS